MNRTIATFVLLAALIVWLCVLMYAIAGVTAHSMKPVTEKPVPEGCYFIRT